MLTLAQAVQNSPEDPTMAAKYTEEGMELVQQLSQEIRTMSYLHPPLLDETGLAEALRWYIQGLSERSGLEIAFIIPDRVEREVDQALGSVCPGIGKNLAVGNALRRLRSRGAAMGQ